MKKLYNTFFVIFSLLLFGNEVYGQDNCGESLVNANKLYLKGNLQGSVDLLNSCSKAFKSKEEKFEAYRLLAKCHLALLNTEEAEKAMVHLLKLRPDYALYASGNEPLDFVKAIKSYTVEPKFILGLAVGYSLNMPDIIENNSPYPDAKSTYDIMGGYSFGMELTKPINGRLGFTSILFATGSSINHRIEDLNRSDLEYNERYDFANLAIGLSYQIKKIKAWNFTGLARLGSGYLYKDNSVITYTDNNNGEVEQFSYKGIEDKNTFQMFGMLGMELGKKIQVGTIGCRINYIHHFSPLFPKNKDTGALEQSLNVGYFNDRLRMKNVSIEFKYSIPLNYSVTKTRD